MVCISGCRGVIGFSVATSQLPVREKVRPARPGVGVSAKEFAPRTKYGPKMAVYGVPGELFRERAAEGPVLGELCRGAPEKTHAGQALSRHQPYAHTAGRTLSRLKRQPTCWDRDSHEMGMKKALPKGVLGRNAEPPPVDCTEGGRCAPGGTRTPNLLNRNQMLYPLSYGRFAVWLGISLHALRQDAKSRVMT